jgi:hypothetical protein
MTLSPLLIKISSVVLLGGTLYAAVAFLNPARPSPVVTTPPPQPSTTGEGDTLVALRQDLEHLRATIEALRPPASDPSPHSSTPAPNPILGTLRKELRQLRAEVDTLRTAVQQTTPVLPLPSTERPAPALPLPRTVEDMTAQMQAQAQRDQEHLAQLDTTLYAEPVDAAWADETAGMLSDVLASADLSATTVRDLTCRRTACRLTVEHTDRQALDQFSLVLPLQVRADLPQLTFFHEEGAEGRLHTVIYLTRQGHSLPNLVR